MRSVGIIGAGVVGATIAYELSKIKGLDITLFEENQEIEGSTRAALGVLVGISSQKKKGRAWHLRAESIKRYPSLIKELETLTQSSIAHNPLGLVHLCFSAESLAKWQSLQEFRKDWKLEIWDPKELSEHCPQVESAEIVAGIYSPSDWQINPVELTNALNKAAEINGVKLKFGKKITQIVKDEREERIIGVKQEGEFFALDHLVIAAGLGSTDLTKELTQNIILQPVLGQAVHLKLETEIESSFQPVVTGNDVHVLPLNQGEYWVGATVEFPNSNNIPLKPDDQLLESVLYKAFSFYPSLKQAKILKHWTGYRPRPINLSAPIIEKLTGYNNVVLATGHYRNGVLLAPATASIVTKMILE